jgi:hypothetical protein
MGKPFTDIRCPGSTPRFYGVQRCEACHAEKIDHPAGHFFDDELTRQCPDAERVVLGYSVRCKKGCCWAAGYDRHGYGTTVMSKTGAAIWIDREDAKVWRGKREAAVLLARNNGKGRFWRICRVTGFAMKVSP